MLGITGVAIVSLRVHSGAHNYISQENLMEQEKDYFWVYIGGVILTVAVVLWMVKSSEHDKYVTSQKAIAEDSANSAYKHSPP